MHIPLKLALLLDLSGAALFFALAVVSLASSQFGFAVGSTLAFLAFGLSAWIQHNRSIGYDTDNGIYAVGLLAAGALVVLLIASVVWVLA